jgi:hypothetical protein
MAVRPPRRKERSKPFNEILSGLVRIVYTFFIVLILTPDRRQPVCHIYLSDYQYIKI